MVRRLEKSSTIVMVTNGWVTDEVKGMPFFSQLKLTGVSPRTSPQSTRVRVSTVNTEDREEEIVPKLKGANTGGTEGKEKEAN